MYSLVLMAALTTGADAMPAHHGGGCCGQSSCCGYSSCNSCCGYSSCNSCCDYSSCNSGCGYSSCYSGCSYGGCGYSGCSYGGCGYSGCGYSSTSYAPAGTVALAPTAAPATIVVSLPADAKLTIDGEATTSTSATRVFQSPSLPLGQEFHYTLKAEATVDGKSVEYSQRVTVRGGQETKISLTPTTGVASR